MKGADVMRQSYVSPLSGRYASDSMKRIFSDDFKFSTWRKLWLVLAQCEQKLGLNITDEQLEEMKAHLTDIDYAVAEAREREVRHDVMAHVYAFGEQCPKAKPIIHLGATSCYVGDNADVLAMQAALNLIEQRLLSVIHSLYAFAGKYAAVPTLGYTHYQPAQPTTVGKRATLWISDLIGDLEDLRHIQATLLPLGCKGATGTQASFLELFEGDVQKVFALDQMIAKALGYQKCVDVSGQTYSRKHDYRVLSLLSGIAQSASKFANDMRLLQHMRELYEPFREKQIGSSAMPYKRNPMMCERINSLARYVINDAQNPAMTAATQWLERTLDDSANRRIAISEGFLATDAVLLIYKNVAEGLTVDQADIAANLERELPHMATETILMDCVKRGLDRQEIHERIRENAFEAARTGQNLLERIAGDSAFGTDMAALTKLLDPKRFTGVAQQQTERFLQQRVQPILDGYTPANEDTEIRI
jgi:adenylosuccinate lyase